MAAHQKGLRMRCPVCFSRENDVVLFREGDEFYCAKCGFQGGDAAVRGMYADLQKKYRLIKRRVTLEELRNA